MQALALMQELLGDKHPDVATSLVNLAALYLQQERSEEAIPLILQAFQIRQEVLGPNHPYTIDLRNFLAPIFNQSP